MERDVDGEVIASTFDEPLIVTFRWPRCVSKKQTSRRVWSRCCDLARLHHVLVVPIMRRPHTGRILTGGIDAGALTRPKRFFGAARNIEGEKVAA